MKRNVSRGGIFFEVYQYAVSVAWYFGCALLLLASIQAWAGNVEERNGITLQSTRAIYSGENIKGITFGVVNDTKMPYLMQSRVDNWALELFEPIDSFDESSSSPFIVLPPLERLGAGEKITLNIRRIQNTLPTDRESVFALQIKAIPAQNKAENSENSPTKDQAQIVLALQNTLKLFYRPEGLPEYNAQLVAQSLQFERKGTQLVVSNPTVFYATFESLSVGGKQLGDEELFKMVPPLGQQTYSFSDIASFGEVRWQLLDDYSVPTELMVRALKDVKNN